MWIIIKRKSDDNTKDPLCIKVTDDNVTDKLNVLSWSMGNHRLFPVTDKYLINPDDILSVQLYDESEYIEESPVNMKPKRRLNEG